MTRKNLAHLLADAIEQNNREAADTRQRIDQLHRTTEYLRGRLDGIAERLDREPAAPAVQILPDGSALVSRITELGETRDLARPVRVF